MVEKHIKVLIFRYLHLNYQICDVDNECVIMDKNFDNIHHTLLITQVKKIFFITENEIVSLINEWANFKLKSYWSIEQTESIKMVNSLNRLQETISESKEKFYFLSKELKELMGLMNNLSND